MKKIFILSLVVLCIQQVAADNTRYSQYVNRLVAVNGSSSFTSFIDRTTIKAHRFGNGEGKYITAWNTRTYAPIVVDGRISQQTKTFYYFDCSAKKWNFEKKIIFDQTGQVIKKPNNPSLNTHSSKNWYKITSETEAELKYVCSKESSASY